MRAVVQRVSHACVKVDGEQVGECGPGLLVLAAAHRADDEETARKLAEKIAHLRIFGDAEGKMNLSLSEVNREPGTNQILVVSNFTVYGDAQSSRRPSFMAAAGYAEGRGLIETFVDALRGFGLSVATGTYGADMKVELVNDGPVTLIVDV